MSFVITFSSVPLAYRYWKNELNDTYGVGERPNSNAMIKYRDIIRNRLAAGNMDFIPPYGAMIFNDFDVESLRLSAGCGVL